MSITRETVLHAAALARLELAPAEIERMATDLRNILGYMEQLSELDVSNVPETCVIGGELGAPLRADIVQANVATDVALSQAPRKSAAGFLVPGFVDEG